MKNSDLIDDLIHKLQDEVLFLQGIGSSQSAVDVDFNMENYMYTLKGELSESRTC